MSAQKRKKKRAPTRGKIACIVVHKLPRGLRFVRCYASKAEARAAGKKMSQKQHTVRKIGDMTANVTTIPATPIIGTCGKKTTGGKAPTLASCTAGMRKLVADANKYARRRG
jgi:hypothetical protein